VDAFVSDLNASRESSQFELDNQNPVYDNNGDPYRFLVRIPRDNKTDLDPCKFKLTASVVDSTIDFHCVNHDYVGLEHHFTWIVGHERVRDNQGRVSQVVSSLYKIELPEPNLNFNAIDTVKHAIKSTDWNTNGSVYFRTPLFVPKINSVSEDDGYIFMWSYENTKVKMLILDAKNLELKMEITIPEKYHIPYSVHSWVYPYLNY
jgi:carotenoid cleavage dioxygenase-like enzyme